MLKRYKTRFFENTIPDVIDFYEGGEVCEPGSPEYKALEALEGDAWTNYLDVMASRGLTVEYDNEENCFKVEG